MDSLVLCVTTCVVDCFYSHGLKYVIKVGVLIKASPCGRMVISISINQGLLRSCGEGILLRYRISCLETSFEEQLGYPAFSLRFPASARVCARDRVGCICKDVYVELVSHFWLF